MSGTSDPWVRDWLEVRADEVRVGDLLANHATVTKSVTGPAKVKWGARTYDLADDECFIACGNGNPHGMAITSTNASHGYVVGRNARRKGGAK